MTTSTWEAEARQEPRLSGAGCTEMGTSRSNREGRDLIVSLDLTRRIINTCPETGNFLLQSSKWVKFRSDRWWVNIRLMGG
jgi:hypothetical protein